ncbi:hypothetical protein PG997_013336 [Apiospora hydei]|uniref:Uncharacterized protein n=1 Tax=Apiospora hydei TaxID=1337664 RepID=A0ABR1V951_9PEZI
MGSKQAQSIESITQEHFEPLIRYHEERKIIPGDPYGWKLPGCGNISHWEEARRYDEYPKFTDKDFHLRDEERADKVKQYLAEIHHRGIDAVLEDGQIVRNTEEEVVVEHQVQGFSVRIMQMCDVSVFDPKSYCNATRSRRLEHLSDQRVAEAPMSRDVENMLMAKRMERGEAPKMPMHRDGTENKKFWYKVMRSESYNVFWVGTSREERDVLREEAKHLDSRRDPALEPLIAQIEKEDRSQSKDYFYHYQRGRAAATDDAIYEKPNHDIVIVLDKDSKVVLAKFSKLLDFLFHEKSVAKMEDAVRKWTALPPLPLPETSRHMVDEMIRLENPHMDLEKATTLKEVEKRVQCVVHYGTWAMKGRLNPDHIHKTLDSRLARGLPRKVLEDIPSQVFPIFTTKAVGLASEAVRFLFSTMAPDEYAKCLDVYKALPDGFKTRLSEPTFSTLFVLGINSYTQRHLDKTDVKFGFASLVGLGSYTGGDLCFPRLALKLEYQPGDCVIFRGRELAHFVHDWDGYRIFLLFTNHQPVRNYAFRKLGLLPSKLKDPWNEDGQTTSPDGNAGGETTLEADKEELDPDDDDYYSPCWKDPVTPEFEEVTEREWQGPAMLPSTSSSADN